MDCSISKRESQDDERQRHESDALEMLAQFPFAEVEYQKNRSNEEQRTENRWRNLPHEHTTSAFFFCLLPLSKTQWQDHGLP